MGREGDVFAVEKLDAVVSGAAESNLSNKLAARLARASSRAPKTPELIYLMIASGSIRHLDDSR